MARRDLSRLLAAAALTLVAAACQSTGPVGTPAGSAVSPPPGSTPGGPATTAEPSALEGEFEIGPGEFFLDPRVGLDVLTSYRQALVVSFNGTADGQARTWSKTYRLQHTAQPAVSILTIAASGDTQPPDPQVIAEAGGASYQLGGDGSCSSQPVDPANSIIALGEPAGLLPALLGAEAAGSETVNGVPANHYTFDGRAMLESGGPVTAGEVWVAADGGYVLRYLRTTTADAAYFGEGLDGTMTWEYGLSDANALTSIALPDACQVDAPIMSGASNVQVLPGYAGFDTQASIAEVIAYYKQQLPARGWAVTSEPFKGDVTGVVEFARGDLVLTLMITTTENGRRVDLALGTGG